MKTYVKDCLQLDIFKGSEVLAGKKGLDREVESVSVLEGADTNIYGNFTQELNVSNELCLSAFLSIRDDVDKQCSIIKILDSKEFSGLVLFYVGHFLPHVDNKLVNLCDELNFPLIIVPMDEEKKLYSIFIKDIMELIFKNKNISRNIMDYFYKQLLVSKNEEKNLQFLLDSITEVTNFKIIIFDEKLNPFYQSNITNPKEIAITKKNCQNKEKVTTSYKIKDSLNNLDYYFHYTTIHIRRKKYIVALIEDDFEMINSLDIQSIVDIIELAANFLSYEEFIIEENELVKAILENNTVAIEYHCNNIDIKPENIESLLITKEEDLNNEDLILAINDIINSSHYKLVRSQYNGFIICFIVRLNSPTIKSKEVVHNILATNNTIKSVIVLENYNSISSISDIFKFTLENYSLITDIVTNNFISQYEVNTIYKTYLDFSNNSINNLDIFEKLDNKNKETLIDTLYSFVIKCNLDYILCSKDLFVHPNTIKYRVNNILTSLDLDIKNTIQLSNLVELLITYKIDNYLKNKKKKAN